MKFYILISTRASTVTERLPSASATCRDEAKHKVCFYSIWDGAGRVHIPVLDKKASDLWFELKRRCRRTSEAVQIYERQLKAPFIPVILLTAI